MSTPSDPLTSGEMAIGRIVRVASFMMLGALLGGVSGLLAGLVSEVVVGFSANPLGDLFVVPLLAAKVGVFVGVLTAALFLGSSGARHLVVSAHRRFGRVLAAAFGATEAACNGDAPA